MREVAAAKRWYTKWVKKRRKSVLFVPLHAAVFTLRACFDGSAGQTHNAGVVGSSPTPAIDEPIT
jgi:hypothetical protein